MLHKTARMNSKAFVRKLLNFPTWDFLKKFAQSDYGKSCEIDDPKILIPIRANVICLLHNLQNGSWVHKHPWLVCTILFPTNKAVWTWAYQLICIKCPGDVAQYKVSVSFTFPVNWAAENKGCASVWNWQYGKVWACGTANLDIALDEG